MSTPRPRRTFGLAAGTLGLLLAASPVGALDLSVREPAFRLGLSLNPDQVHAGVQVHLGRPKSIRFRPSLDIGAGNGVRMATVNADALYRGGQGRSALFVGGGPGLNFVDVTSGVGEGRGVETKVIFSGVLGLSFGARSKATPAGRWRYFVEVRAGVGDTSDAKLTAGLGF